MPNLKKLQCRKRHDWSCNDPAIRFVGMAVLELQCRKRHDWSCNGAALQLGNKAINSCNAVNGMTGPVTKEQEIFDAVALALQCRKRHDWSCNR